MVNKVFTIYSIGIIKTHRGKKYGKLLIDTVIDKYPDIHMALHVRTTNKSAQKLYKSVDFSITKIDKNYYKELNEDAYYMEKNTNTNYSFILSFLFILFILFTLFLLYFFI
jgi:ribosomal protein S18 acetylase RimI-like enzyme